MMKWRRFLLITAMLGIVAFTLGAGCSSSDSATMGALQIPSFDEQRAWSDLKYQVLGSDNQLHYRIPGTADHDKIKDWLVAQLTPSAKSVTLQPFSKVLSGKNVQMWNIIADIPGTREGLHERVLLAAHWDSRPIADHDPVVTKHNTPIPGANDGASGVAILLEIARQLKAHPISRDVSIVLFDGEDYGPNIDNMLLGSQYYAAHLPEAKPDWGILLDMVGDKNLDIYREPYSEEHAKTVDDRIFAAAHTLAFMKTGAIPGFVDAPFSYEIEDDHTPVNEAGIPMADVIDFDYSPWHTTGDSVDKCSAESLRIVGKTMLYALTLP